MVVFRSRASAPHFLGGHDVVLDADHVGGAEHASMARPKARELNDHVDTGGDLTPQSGERNVAAAHHQHVLQPGQRIARGVGMQGAHRSGVAGIHGLEHLVGLAAAHLADDDPVRAHSKRVDQQVPHAHLAGAFRAHGPRFEAHHVRLLELQLGRILDGHQTLAMRYLPRHRVHERGLSGAGAAADQDVEPRLHRDTEQLRHCRRHHPALSHIVETRAPHDEAPDRDGGAIERERRNNYVDAGPVG